MSFPFRRRHRHHYAHNHIWHTLLQRDNFTYYVATTETVDPFSSLSFRAFRPSGTEFSVCRLVSGFLPLSEYRFGEILPWFHTSIHYLSLKSSQSNYLDSVDWRLEHIRFQHVFRCHSIVAKVAWFFELFPSLFRNSPQFRAILSFIICFDACKYRGLPPNFAYGETRISAGLRHFAIGETETATLRKEPHGAACQQLATARSRPINMRL